MKRFLLIAFLACLAIVAFGWWQRRQAILDARLADVAAADAVEAALAKRISTAAFAGQERRWGDVLAALRSRADVPLIVDHAEAKSMGVDRQTRVYVPAGMFPLGALLDEITGGMDLGWRRSGGKIEITSQSVASAARDKLFTRIYPLPAATAAGAKLTDDAEQLCELMVTAIEPDSWDEVGGDGVMTTAGGAVVVYQTAEIHQQIRAFLSQMEHASLETARQSSLDRNLDASDDQVPQTLAQQDSVDFHDEPLDRALQSLTARHGLRFQFSAEALANGAANPAIPMTLSLSNVSLQTILHELLTPQQLTCVVRNGSLEVTTIDAAESHLPHAFYDVRDLIETSGQPDFDSLIETITTTVEPDSWDEVGGPGTIAEMGDRWLVVSQTQEIQEQAQRLLARIRAILAPGVDPAGDMLIPTDDVSPAVERALDREVTLNYENRPLRDVCTDLSQRMQIPVMLRTRILVDEGIDPLLPVTIDLPSLPLRDALAILVEQQLLIFQPRGEILHVTTDNDAENGMATRVTDVRHLLDVGGGITEDTLDDLVTSCVAPDSWDEVGGPGTIQIYRGLLVVSQTYDIHRQVQELMEALNEHCLPALSRVAVQADGQPPHDPIWIGLTPQERQIVAKLNDRSHLRITNSRVDAAISALCQQHGIPVVMDRQWRDQVESDPFWPILSLDIDGAPLRDILAKVLANQPSGMTVTHSVLFVTDRDSAESHVLRRLYHLGRCATDGQPLKPADVEVLLMERIEPDTWDERGGQGVIGIVTDEWLLVLQTLPMHRRVEEALAKLHAGQTLPLPPEIPDGMWEPLASPAIQALFRLMKRAIPGGSQ